MTNLLDHVTGAIAAQIKSGIDQPEDLARAAIMAMEPTAEMLEHGAYELVGLSAPGDNQSERIEALKEAWDVMLRSGLA
jgi:hypothetical protein